MHPLRQLAHDTALYGLSSMLGRICHYLLVPFYTSLLLPSEYGIITEFYAYAAFLNVLYSYGMETTYFKFATQHEPKTILKLTISLLLGSSILLSSILIGLAAPLSKALGYIGHERYVYYLAALVTLDTLLMIPFAQLRLNNQALRFASLKCLQIGVQIGLNIVLLYILPTLHNRGLPNFLKPIFHLYNPSPEQHIDYILLANLIGNSMVLPFLGKQLTTFSPRISWKKVGPMVVYATPLLVIGLAGTTNEMLSRVLLKHFLPINTDGQPEIIIGIFGACYKLAMLMALAIQAFRFAADPFFFKERNNPHAPQLFNQVMQVYILIGCFIWFAISANLDTLGYLFLRNPIYRTGIAIIPYLALGYLWLGIYYNLSIWFKLVHKTHYGAWITILGAFITIILNASLIPIFSYWGCVAATVFSYFTMAIVCYYQGRRRYPIPYQVGRGLGYIAITLVLVVLVRHIPYPNRLWAFLSNVIFTFSFGLSIYKLLQRTLGKASA